MAKHHPDLIFCRKQPGVGKFFNWTTCTSLMLQITSSENQVSLFNQ